MLVGWGFKLPTVAWCMCLSGIQELVKTRLNAPGSLVSHLGPRARGIGFKESGVSGLGKQFGNDPT